MKSLLLSSFLLAAASGGVSAQAAKPASKSASDGAGTTFIVAATNNEARYRVREQLAGFDLPKDAVGATKDVAGRIVIGPDGKVVKESSKVTIELSTLKSDQGRRDNYLRRSTLETSKYPQAQLVPVALEGLLLPIAPGSSQTFSVRGDLTVHGTTHPTTWQVTARGEGNGIVGTATTAFTFKDFGLEQPRVPVVLSVADTIRLEYDFHFVPDTTSRN